MPHLLPRLTRTRGQLALPAVAMAGMLAEGWRTWPNETGGILLGRNNGTCTHVTTVIGPGPSATHERYGFQPDSDWQAAEVAAHWHRDPDIEYLGDWHTHPQGSTRFSALDTDTARAIASAHAARQPNPVMVVLALGRDGTCRTAAARLFDERLAPVTLAVQPGVNPVRLVRRST